MTEKEHQDQERQEPELADSAIEEEDEDAVEAHMPWGSAQPDQGA